MLKPDRRSFLSPLQDLTDLRDPAAAPHADRADQPEFSPGPQPAGNSPHAAASHHATASHSVLPADSSSEPAPALDKATGNEAHPDATGSNGPGDNGGQIETSDSRQVSTAGTPDSGFVTGGWPSDSGRPAPSASGFDAADPAPGHWDTPTADTVVVHESLEFSGSAFVWKQSIDTWSAQGHAASIDTRIEAHAADSAPAADSLVAALSQTGSGETAYSASMSYTTTSSLASSVNSTYDIQINFSGDARFRPAFDAAIARWEQIITTDLPDVSSSSYGFVDDLLIDASVISIDGTGNILGQAGPDAFRSDYLSYHGVMEFDSADADSMLADGTFYSVVLHEMGHVLGFGTVWDVKGLLSGYNYTGANAVNEYRTLTGNNSLTSIPVEDQGGDGTAGSHWRESVFDNELMTGYAEAPGVSMPISRMTIASLADLGYTVNLGAADAYTLPGGPVSDDYAATTATAGAVSANGSATGTINYNGDHDWFRLTMIAGHAYTFDLAAAGAGVGTLSDAYLNLRNGAGTVIASDDDSGTGADSHLVYTAASSGTYYLDAGAFDDSGTGTYRLSVAVSNTAPVVAVNDHSVHTTTWTQVQSWIAYSDADSDAATYYQFIDNGAAAGSVQFWTTAGGYQAANATLTVAASGLANVWVGGASTVVTDQMWVRAFDGFAWSGWDSFNVNATNTAPVATIGDHSLHTGTWTQVQDWLSYTDADSDSAVRYEFADLGHDAGSGQFWTPAGGYHAAGPTLSVAASDLANVWVGGATANGTDQMWVRAFDGASWSDWDEFNFTSANTAPVAAIGDHTQHVGAWAQVQGWVSYSDGDGDSAVQYQFYDGGTAAGSSQFWVAGSGYQAANTVINVTADKLGDVWAGGGANIGTDQMWVRAFDGAAWSAWDSFNFIATNAAPAATIDDHSLALNQWTQVSNWLNYSDADGDAATQYQFVDLGSAAGSGQFWTPTGGYHAAGPTLAVAAADLNNVWVGGATATGTDQMWVRAYDGHAWSGWDSFTLTSHA